LTSFDAGTTRRGFISRVAAGAAVLGSGGLFAACGSGSSGGGAAKGSGKVYVRQSGGEYQDANTKAIFQPFSKETGIEVVTVQVDSAPMLAQIQQGKPQFDLIDNSEADQLVFNRKGALQEIQYDRLKNFKRDDFPERLAQPWMLGKIYWASAMAYRTDAFKTGGPQSWADFWDTGAFPGKRALQDNTADVPELEFALLADGVPVDQLYPLDVDRAFRVMDRIKSSVVKFWDAGALPGALLARKEVVASSIWNGRAAALIDKRAPITLEWAGARRQANAWTIPKGAKNVENAHKLIDFALRPDVQAHVATLIPYGPVAKSAQSRVPADVQKVLPTAPGVLEKGFDLDVEWWLDNQDAVLKRWKGWASA
jgi:putative spermidine/putrescine transport system substrate-binding protein